MATQPPTVSVIIPSYQRVKVLSKCLDALGRMEVLPDEIVVIARDIDTETQEFVRAWISGDPERRVLAIANRPGQIAAMEVGFHASKGAIVAYTDDDAQPHVDWLKRMLAHYQDPTIGGVGGRDLLWRNGEFMAGKAGRVGYISWYGRITGDSYLEFSGVQEVETLKGVNMSFRRQFVKFDHNLLGTPTQWPSDTSITLAAKRMGARLICDPNILVDHYEFPRPRGDERKQMNLESYTKKSHNITYLLLKYLPWYRWPIFFLYTFLIGQQNTPGVFYDITHGKLPRIDVFIASMKGKLMAFQTYRRWRAEEQRVTQTSHATIS
jgi:glycosyltransferase involved in cell wall biosynthesis